MHQKRLGTTDLGGRYVHYETFRGSGILWNLYFKSRISHPIPAKISCATMIAKFQLE